MKRKKPWGGRFEGETHGQVEAFTASIHFDQRLAAHDIAGSIAHAQMLGKCGILSKGDVDAIVAGLGEIREEIERGQFRTDPALEDIHMHIEQRLRDKIGEAWLIRVLGDRRHRWPHAARRAVRQRGNRNRNRGYALDQRHHPLDQGRAPAVGQVPIRLAPAMGITGDKPF